jgi:hypothetical protein
MKAAEIEKLYQQTIFGYDEPEVMYLRGETLKRMLLGLGDTTTKHTNDGHLIVDAELYCMTKKGIYLVE